MTAFHGLQLALFGGALGLSAWHHWQLLFRSALDTRPYLGALSEALLRKSPAVAALLHGSSGTAVGQLAAQCIDDDTRAADRLQLQHWYGERAFAGVAPLRTLGRMASPLAFIGAIVELGRVFSGDAGLVGLQRGLPEQLASEHAVLSIVIGLCTSLSCFVAAGRLRRHAQKRWHDLQLTVEVIETTAQAREET